MPEVGMLLGILFVHPNYPEAYPDGGSLPSVFIHMTEHGKKDYYLRLNVICPVKFWNVTPIFFHSTLFQNGNGSSACPITVFVKKCNLFYFTGSEV